jgi:putative ABC transport system substrate-binding protein
MSKRILVVEDQEDNRQIIRDLLSATDYELTEADRCNQCRDDNERRGCRGIPENSHALYIWGYAGGTRFITKLRIRGSHMQRREFITLLGGAAAWPLAASAQRSAMPMIGYLHSASLERNVNLVAAFRKGLGETGFVEGQNVAIEFRWAAGQNDRLPELAAELVRGRVAVIATPVNTPATLAAKAATATIPIVFAIGGDPVALGLVESLSRPGGNATGISFQTVELTAKRLGLLRELAPGAKRLFALINPNSGFTAGIIKNLQASAQALGLPVDTLHASTDREIDAAFANLQKPDGALLLSPDAFYTSRRKRIVALAARYAVPTIYNIREFTDVGGLISYGPNLANVCQQTGIYTGRILKGEKPANLPVMQPTKFELIVNLKTAKTLGLSIPPALLTSADEVIE